MTVNHSNLYRGTLTTNSSAIVYTVPTEQSVIITNIAIANITSSSDGAYVLLDGVPLLKGGRVNAKDMMLIDTRQVLASGKTIVAYSDSANALTIHINGVVIS